MLYAYKELEEKLGNYSKVKKAVNDGLYIKVSHGIYTDESPSLSELESIFKRYPNAILTLESAFSYYDMSDYVPNKYVVASAQNAHRINNKKVNQLFISEELLNIGKIKIKTKCGIINIYDKERLLIELFRLKNKLSYPYFKEVVNSYRELFKDGLIDNNKLASYCSKFKNGENLKRRIQEVVL